MKKVTILRHVWKWIHIKMLFLLSEFGLFCVQVSQLQHVVSVKDALLRAYTDASDELESSST